MSDTSALWASRRNRKGAQTFPIDLTAQRAAVPASEIERRGVDALGYRVEVFRSFAEAERIWRTAQELCACSAFQTFDWLSIWQETIGIAAGMEPHIVHIGDASGGTLMILPLGTQRRFGLSFLSFLGGVVTDYHAPLIRTDYAARLDRDNLGALWRRVLALLPRVDVVVLEKMPAVIEETPNPFVALPGSKRAGNAHSATLASTWEQFKKRRSTKLFADSNRRRRRLAEIAEPEFRMANSPALASEVIRALARQKSRRWRETGARDLFAEPGYLAFYEKMTERQGTTGLVHVSALSVAGTLVATHWGMVHRNRFYYLIQGKEEGWSRYSVGRLLMMNLIEWSISQGMDVFDLTLGDEDYKHEWADSCLPLHDCVAALTLQGRVYLGCALAYERLKRSAKRHAQLLALVRRLSGKARDVA